MFSLHHPTTKLPTKQELRTHGENLLVPRLEGDRLFIGGDRAGGLGGQQGGLAQHAQRFGVAWVTNGVGDDGLQLSLEIATRHAHPSPPTPHYLHCTPHPLQNPHPPGRLATSLSSRLAASSYCPSRACVTARPSSAKTSSGVRSRRALGSVVSRLGVVWDQWGVDFDCPTAHPSISRLHQSPYPKTHFKRTAKQPHLNEAACVSSSAACFSSGSGLADRTPLYLLDFGYLWWLEVLRWVVAQCLVCAFGCHRST